MSVSRLTRTAPRLARVPIFPRAFVMPELPFGDTAAGLGARAEEMIRSAFAEFPEFPGFVPEKFPLLNLSEAKDEFTVTAELPGMAQKDVTVDYCDGVLTIRGEKEREETKEEDDRKYYMWERRFGSFQRSIPFPGGIDENRIAADFKDGVLTVHLPKAEEARTKHRTVPINNGDQK